MGAVVLAGGLGTRLRNLVPNVPKVLAPIAGKSFLEILLSDLSKRGFKHIILSLGYMADSITSHFGNHFCGMDIDYAIEKEALGTGVSDVSAYGAQ